MSVLPLISSKGYSQKPSMMLRLELILMLKVNRALWNASTIDEILNDGFSEEKEADSDVDDDI